MAKTSRLKAMACVWRRAAAEKYRRFLKACLVGDIITVFSEHLIYIALRERESGVEPHGVALGRER